MAYKGALPAAGALLLALLLVHGCTREKSTLTICAGLVGKDTAPAADLPGWLRRWNLFVYGEPPLTYLEQAGGTAVVWSVYHGGVNSTELEYVRTLHSAGMAVASNFPTEQGSTTVIDDPAFLQRTACRDIYGSTSFALWIQPNPPYLPCNNNPDWDDFLAQRAREHVDGEVDAIHIDEVEGIEGQLYTAGFCPFCMAGFRSYLKTHFSPSDLLARFGITDVDTFDYGAYLRNHGVYQISGDPDPALRTEFVKFQLLSRYDQIGALITETRQYAQQQYGRYVAFGANTFFMSANKQLFLPFMDFVVYENSLDFPPRGEYLGTHLLARAALPHRWAVMFPNIVDLLDFQAGGDWDVFLHWLSEAYAAGEGFLVPYDAYAFGGGQSSVTGQITLPAQLVRPYADLFKQYYPQVGQSHMLADVGVVYPYRQVLDEYIDRGYATPWEASEPTHQLFLDMTRILQNDHIQFNVVYVGDGTFVKRPLDDDDLIRYKALVIPDTWTPDADEQRILNTYRLCGGHIVKSGDVVDGSALGELGSLSSVSTDAPPTVGIVSARSGSTVLLHFINYAYDGQAHRFTDTGPFNVSIALPAGLTCTDTSLAMSEPGKPSAALGFTTTDRRLYFTVPDVHIYSLAVFGQCF